MRAPSSKTSKAINMEMADRLRDLIDLVLSSLDEPRRRRGVGASARTSRATTWTGCWRRRRASRRWRCGGGCCWSGRRGSCAAGVPPSEAAEVAGYGSVAAFSRAFSRAYGAPPSAFDGEVQLPAPNGIHFHPPAGLLIPATPRSDLTDRMVSPPPRPGARAAAGGGDAVGRGARAGAPARAGGGVVRGRGAERGADVRAARVHARGVGGGDRRAGGAGVRRRRLAAPVRARGAGLRADRQARSATAAPTTTRSWTRCASRRSRSPTAACSRTCWRSARCAARRWPACWLELGADVSEGDPIVWEFNHSRHSSVRSGAPEP